MGIKFYCPNGHKLNVKSFLGGKRAICPKCGAKVVVPAEAGGPERQPQTLDPVGLAEAMNVGAIGPEPAGDGDDGHAALDSISDPFSDAPTAVWYVRPATGGQFGPASADIMRRWLNDGRVGASSLVWRAGWAEWRAAAAVFPQLAELLASPGITVAPPHPLAGGQLHDAGKQAPTMSTSLPTGQIVQSGVGPDDFNPLATPLPQVRKRRRNDRSILASAVLVVIVIVLLVVLLFVVRRQYSSQEAMPIDAGAPADVSGHN